MTYRTLATVLLLLSALAVIATIFAPLLPGAWWQWLLTAAVLVIAAAGASNAADLERRP